MAIKDGLTAARKQELLKSFVDFCKHFMSTTAAGMPARDMLVALTSEETVASLQVAPWNFSAAKAQAIFDVKQAVVDLRTAIQTAKNTLEA